MFSGLLLIRLQILRIMVVFPRVLVDHLVSQHVPAGERMLLRESRFDDQELIRLLRIVLFHVQHRVSGIDGPRLEDAEILVSRPDALRIDWLTIIEAVISRSIIGLEAVLNGPIECCRSAMPFAGSWVLLLLDV